MIPYGRQDVSDADIAAVVDVLRSDFLTQGPQVPGFEQALCDYTGSAHAVAVNSATSALHLACLALGLGPGDLLWTTPITFVASANCALHCRAEVDFVDIDPTTYNLCPGALERKLARARTTGRLPKVVVPVHLCGRPCDMARIGALAGEYGFSIIEDASHAIGGRYHGEPVGSSRYSDVTVFSFHPVKLVTTGEGGAAMTNSAELAWSMRLHRSHGITRDADRMTRPPDGPWYYEQIALGCNYRMTDLQAALGRSQLRRLDEFVGARRRLAARYDRLLRELPLVTPAEPRDGDSALHLYVVLLDLDRTTRSRREVFEQLRQAGIGVNVHYIPVHTQPHYRALGCRPGDFPRAEAYYERALTLPLFAAMTETQQDAVVRALREVLS